MTSCALCCCIVFKSLYLVLHFYVDKKTVSCFGSCACECVNDDRMLRSSSAITYRDGQLHNFRNENNAAAALYVCSLSVISPQTDFLIAYLFSD